MCEPLQLYIIGGKKQLLAVASLSTQSVLNLIYFLCSVWLLLTMFGAGPHEEWCNLRGSNPSRFV